MLASKLKVYKELIIGKQACTKEMGCKMLIKGLVRDVLSWLTRNILLSCCY